MDLFSDTRASTDVQRLVDVELERPVASASSSCVAGRPSVGSSLRAAARSLLRRSWTCVGTRIVRDWPATERCTAWRIHHVA